MDTYYNNTSANSPPSPESSTPSPIIPEHALSDQRQKKKHPCTYPNCTRAFTTAGHLARHARVHTGEKNHACPFPGCETRCSRQDNLQQHYRIHLAPGSRRTSARSAADRRSTRSASTPYPTSVASTSAIPPPPPVDSPPQLVPATLDEYQKRYPMGQSSPIVASSWAGDSARYSDSSSRAPTRQDSTSSYGGDEYYQRSSPSHSTSYTQSTVLPPLQHRDDSAYYSQSPSYSPSTYSSPSYSHSPSYSTAYNDHPRSHSYREGSYSTSGSYAPRTEVYRDTYVEDYRQQQQFVSV